MKGLNMKKSVKCSNIPVLSILAKATIIVLPCALLSLPMAHANTVVTATDFPVVGEEGLTQFYLNHIYSAEWGNNLIVNPSFSLCGAYVESKVYTMTPASTLWSEYDNPGTATRQSCEKHNGWMVWGWTERTSTSGDPSDPQQKGLIAGANSATHPHVESPHYAPPDHGGGKYFGQLLAQRKTRLMKPIAVTEINEVYFELDWARQGITDTVMQLEFTPTTGETFIIDIASGNHENDPYWDDNYWKHIQLARSFDTPFTGTINFFYQVAGDSPASKIDNIFLGTDISILPLPDSDEDGTSDGDDDFINNHVAYLDSDGDGMPDFFTASECKELVTAESETEEGEVIEAVYGDDFAECGGLTLDTDDDNDGDSDIDEITAGTDPLDDTSILADTDADGWYNANDKGLPVNDAYPNSNQLHLAKENYINVLSDYSPDAETAVILDTVGVEKNEWLWAHNTNGTPTIEHEIVETTGHDGELTKAFKVAVPAGSTVQASKHVRIESPILTTVNQDVRLVRVAGWIKATGVVPNDTAQSIHVFVASNIVDGESTKGEGKTVNWTFSETSNDFAIYNQSIEDNNGWHYFEQAFEYSAAIVDTKLQLLLKTDVAGVEMLFDDLELNFIPNGNADGLGELNATDRDDDNDGILDGDDANPLGDAAFNATLGYSPSGSLDTDLDGILDGYDDDRDGDGIADAFDDFLLAITIEQATPVHDAEARTITIEPVVSQTSGPDPEVTLIHTWTANGVAYGGITDDNSATLVLNEMDFVGGTTPIVELTVTAETPQGGMLVQKRVWNPTIAADSIPTVELSMEATADEKAVFSITNVYDVESDDLVIKWLIDGVELGVSDNANSVTLHYADYSAAASVVVTATVSEVNRPVHNSSHSLTWFVPAEKKEPYSGSGGSMHWWLLAMLTTRLFTRRNR